MQVFGRLRIGLKLGLAFAVVLLLLTGVIAFGLVQVQRLEESSDKLAAGTLRRAILAHNAQNAAQAQAARLNSLFLLDKQIARIPVYVEIDRQNKILTSALEQLASHPADEHERRLLDQVGQSRARFTEALNTTVDAVELDLEGARAPMLRQALPALETLLGDTDALVTLQAVRLDNQTAEIRAAETASKRWMLVLGLAAVSVGCLSALAITRSIVRPLVAALSFADGIAAGRLDGTLPAVPGDEIGHLIDGLERMRSGIVEREERITQLAYRDALTDLPNRTLFSERLHQAVATASRAGHATSVLTMDLDRFKHVNDVLGHESGDELLRAVASRLTKTMLRESDTVARLGGDEFAILLPTQGSQDALLVAERILRTLETPITLEGQPIDVGASIGIASFPEHGKDASELMSRADAAMYLAKRTNSGAMIFCEAPGDSRRDSLSLLGELRQALEQNQLVLYFQPKVGLASGLTQHVEALVRWVHPERGMVPPDRFIPFAEQTGYIKAITRWVIENACMEIARWERSGLRVGVSINISAHDLTHQDLPGIFAAQLSRFAVAPEALCLEITESAIMDDPRSALAALERLHQMNLRLSIDDFGTGYSSLAYLKRLPVQELKIDKSFVLNMASDADDAAIVRSTIDLAHNMGLKVVAEGIETEQIWNLLRAWGCDYGQGYYVSRPLPAADLEAWYQRQAAA